MAWVLGASFVGSFGAVFLKLGATRLRNGFESILTNWRLAMGVMFYLLSSILFVFGIRKGELSVLFPMLSLGSVWTVLGSRLFLGESITRSKASPLALFLAGFNLLAFGCR